MDSELRKVFGSESGPRGLGTRPWITILHKGGNKKIWGKGKYTHKIQKLQMMNIYKKNLDFFIRFGSFLENC